MRGPLRRPTFATICSVAALGLRYRLVKTAARERAPLQTS